MRVLLAVIVVVAVLLSLRNNANAQWLICQVKGTQNCIVARKCAPSQIWAENLQFETRQRACAWAQDRRGFDEDAFRICGRKARGCYF
jgi:hypothetical protein